MKLAEFHPGFVWAEHTRRARLVARFPDAVRQAVIEQCAALDETDYKAANRLATRLAGELKVARLHCAFDEQAIRDHAENYARIAARLPDFDSRASFAAFHGVRTDHLAEPPHTLAGANARLADSLWWRRQLRKAWTRAAENGQRELGLIRRGRAPYASDEAVKHRAAQKRRVREFLEGHQVVSEEGVQLPLIELAEHSLANPALRRGEFMTRCRGFEEIARDLGHVAEFVTLTAPSAFHAELAAGGRNPAFERAIVRDAQAWLCKAWARARAKLKRLSVLFYGFRIAEPHHDATPHWHLLLFSRPADADRLRMVLRCAALSTFGHEPGAAEHRCKFERIDAVRGGAAGYIAKYVSKNIDGAGAIGNDRDHETNTAVSDGIRRVDAWASVHGIRQFQQVGGPPVGLWREARRLRDRVPDPDMERARACADRGDWRGFTQRVGGIHAGRRTNLRIERCETGALNRYGEPRAPAIIGLRYASAVAITRPHQWRIERAACSARRSSPIFSALGPVAITVRGAPTAGAPSAWSNPQETSQAGPQ